MAIFEYFFYLQFD